MKLRNTDNPVDEDTFNRDWRGVARRHGLNRHSVKWNEFHNLIGSPLDSVKQISQHYQAYLAYCKLCETPLMKDLE